ncbi:hypothetical protein F511_16834 [Dorcoceras hygrometricum]|uniref:IST1-like protein n=1 Tax=Dorcoceras hygrometricum TaxID=472368 RepID=A0A2Z7APU0_9LAMI|nr:hypothetical protein F511_16834 [Dorcoceras hygrometricum]
MFDFLFGWRKASKCKSLLKKVQCRVKLATNKRCCIVRQLRQDVAELLKHGHTQTAFERVEQLLKDQSMVEVYDLVGSFCEFVIMNLGYIRKHKDCSNDINEAVSTLIFTSARLGDLPELLSVRKLFVERYGINFVTAALELLPGNLVNNQIKENLIYAKKVADDVKYRLLDEIASTCIEPGPLFLEYRPSNLLENRETETKSTLISNKEIWTGNGDGKIRHITKESQGKIVHTDNYQSERSRDDHKRSPNPIRLSVLGENRILGKLSEGNYKNESFSSFSSSETSSRLPEELIYMDDIEEFVSPSTKKGDVHDQRLFMFKPFEIPSKESAGYVSEANPFKGPKLLQYGENSLSISSRLAEKPSRTRTRRRSSASQETRSVTDAECELYYGVFRDQHESNYHQREDRYKILVDSFDHEGGNSERSCYVTVKSSINVMRCGYDSMGFVWKCNTKKCAIEHPHHFYFRDKNDSLERLSWTPKTEDHAIQSTKTAKIEDRPYFCKDSVRCKAQGEARNEARLPCLRAMTMPNARPVEIVTDDMFRSNSFPLETPRSCRHIHPKLPDYDELAAKFMALKRENFQSRNTTSKPVI